MQKPLIDKVQVTCWHTSRKGKEKGVNSLHPFSLGFYLFP